MSYTDAISKSVPDLVSDQASQDQGDQAKLLSKGAGTAGLDLQAKVDDGGNAHRYYNDEARQSVYFIV